MHQGERVRLGRDVERFDEFMAEAGLTGKVAKLDADVAIVILDQPLKYGGAHIIWGTGSVASIKEFAEDVETIPTLDSLLFELDDATHVTEHMLRPHRMGPLIVPEVHAGAKRARKTYVTLNCLFART